MAPISAMKGERNKMEIVFHRPLYLMILKVCLCLVLAFLLNTIPFTHICNAENDKQRVVAVFTNGTGRELCRFKIELAVTPEEQSQGLMFRKNLRPDSGMLFVGSRDELRSFWMRNTYISLDMLFIDSHNEVKHIHYGAKPFDDTSISSRHPVQYVLEINASRAKKCNIRQGTKMNILPNPR
jgi:uncharacterized membrane protein (UPF0127 family)